MFMKIAKAYEALTDQQVRQEGDHNHNDKHNDRINVKKREGDKGDPNKTQPLNLPSCLESRHVVVYHISLQLQPQRMGVYVEIEIHSDCRPTW